MRTLPGTGLRCTHARFRCRDLLRDGGTRLGPQMEKQAGNPQGPLTVQSAGPHPFASAPDETRAAAEPLGSSAVPLAGASSPSVPSPSVPPSSVRAPIPLRARGAHHTMDAGRSLGNTKHRNFRAVTFRPTRSPQPHGPVRTGATQRSCMGSLRGSPAPPTIRFLLCSARCLSRSGWPPCLLLSGGGGGRGWWPRMRRGTAQSCCQDSNRT